MSYAGRYSGFGMPVALVVTVEVLDATLWHGPDLLTLSLKFGLQG